MSGAQDSQRVAGSHRRYRAVVLAALDPQWVWDELHELVFPAEPVLLCYEGPPFGLGHDCHRRFVARWFEETLDVDVPEFEPRPAANQRDLFDR